MFRLLGPAPDRREVLRAGGLSALGLTLPALARARATPSPTGGRAKSCILLFFLGGPPQQSTWDPKPDAPAEVRGEFGPIDTVTPGVRLASTLPLLARQTDKLCLLRAVSTGDHSHSSSGYYMLTGQPHSPVNVDNLPPAPPNDHPTLAAVVRRLRGDRAGLPGAVRLPHHIFNTGGTVWPGQDAGFLGRGADPWMFRYDPTAPVVRVPEFTLSTDVPPDRLADRRDLLARLDRGLGEGFGRLAGEGFNLLGSPQARAAFDLNREPPAARDRYGRHSFGQSCLLARRLVEAGVSLVQVNWYRGPDEPPDAPCWDTHRNEAERLKTALCPPADRAVSALLDDLSQRGLLDETLVVCTAEFGRTPRFNGAGGRDHWGSVFTVALAGGGVRGGQVVGASDRQGAYPVDGRVLPEDLTATVFHALGYAPDAEFVDPLGRPLPVSRGRVVRNVF